MGDGEEGLPGRGADAARLPSQVCAGTIYTMRQREPYDRIQAEGDDCAVTPGGAEVAPWSFPLLGLDVSPSMIGLALAESAAALPQPLFTYTRVTRSQDLAQCVAWVQRYQVQGVVLGLPLNMDGSAGARAQWMQRFRRELHARIPIPVLLQDERLSTVEAEEILIAQGLGREARAARIDAVAAALILERFLQIGARPGGS